MQANVPQPANDEDETDDVDEELKKLQVSIYLSISILLSIHISIYLSIYLFMYLYDDRGIHNLKLTIEKFTTEIFTSDNFYRLSV